MSLPAAPREASQPSERPVTPDWARGTGLTADGPLAALLGQPRWCCWAWQNKGGRWTKRPLSAPDAGQEPRGMGADRAASKGRPYALAQAAVLAGNADGVGWLMLDEPELVWLDLDHCRDPATGAVDAWAQAIIDRAGGCYAEVTPSGAGIRLCGRAARLDAASMQGVWRPPEGGGARPGGRGQVEIFYACVRFVTVTGRVLEGHEGGSLGVDLSDLAFELRQAGLAQEPRRKTQDGGRQGVKPPEELTGPIEDVVAALAVIPNGEGWGENLSWNDWNNMGMAVWNATGASWEGLEAWIGWSGQHWKHDDRECLDRWEGYSRSPPDRIGFGHIMMAASAATDGGFRRPSRRPESEFSAEEPGNGDAGGSEGGEGDASPFARLARGLVYVEDLHRFLDVDDKALLKDEQVRARAGAMGCEGAAMSGPKGIVAQLHSHPADPKLLRRVKALTMRPGQGLLVMEGGRLCANLWRPSALVPSDADASPWVRHMEALIPDAAEREAVLDRMAFLLQRPGVKINSGLLLLGGQEDGKDTGLEPLMQALGSHNVSVERGTGMDQQFNTYMKRQLLLISEVPPWHRKSFYEDIKQWMTVPPHVVRINDKLVPHYDVPNIINVIATSNHDDAVALPPNERRFFVVRTAGVGGPIGSQEKEGYYAQLYRWFEAGGYAAAAGWLMRRDVSGFNPKARPMMTQAKHEMIKQGSSPAVTWACELLEEGGAMERRRLTTVKELRAYAARAAQTGELDRRTSLSEKAAATALTVTGWRKIEVRVPDDDGRPYVWARGGAVELLEKLPPQALHARLLDDRGKNTGISDGKAWNAGD